MENRMRAIWLFLQLWDLKTLFWKYDTQEKWEADGHHLDFSTAWAVAKGIWIEDCH